METEPEVLKEKIHTEPILNDPRYITLLSVIVLLFTLEENGDHVLKGVKLLLNRAMKKSYGTVFWWCFSRRRQLRRSVLLTGLSDSGKTLLFVRLAYSQYRLTFTSMRENVEEYITSNNVLKIVDVPGHDRLRKKFFDQYKSSAKAIVYVVDSVTIQKEIRDVAEYLYTILLDPVVQKNSPPILILCNKQDQPMAKGSQVIKSLLEKELNLVRVTKSSQLQSTDSSQVSNAYLGKSGKDFEFSHISSKVDVFECSANTGDDDDPTDMKALQDWISKL